VSVGTTTAAGTGNILIGTGNNQLGVGSILADAQFSLTGTFTGNSGNTLGYIAGLSLTTTMSPDVSRNAFVCRLAPTIVEAASGTHTLLAALRIILTITNGGATTTDAAGMDVNTFAAAAGTTTASGIRVDGPTGATNNYAINVLSGNSLFVGNITANALIPASSTVPTNGMYLATTNAVAFATNSGERVRFHASGGVSIGNTTDPGGTSLSVTGAGTFGAVLTVNAGGVTAEGVSQFTHASGIALSVFSQTGAGSTPMAIYQRHGSNGDYLMSFRNSSAAEYGSVTQVNGTTIAFNTTSDQRLKRDHGRCVDLTLLRRLIVHDAAWAADGMRYPMFFAQEVMHEAPFIVTAGDPDWATNPDVRRPWMTHAVELIPALTAGWQDHDARLEALERRAA
jgi:hypothetical protein